MNDTGLNKWDWIALGTGVACLAANIIGIVAGHKGNVQRANEINMRLDPSIRNQPPHK